MCQAEWPAFSVCQFFYLKALFCRFFLEMVDACASVEKIVRQRTGELFCPVSARITKSVQLLLWSETAERCLLAHLLPLEWIQCGSSRSALFCLFCVIAFDSGSGCTIESAAFRIMVVPGVGKSV